MAVEKRRPTVAICGPRVASQEALGLAEALGQGVAERGWILVTGGMGGVMEAASKGAARVVGSTVVGILPGEDAAGANDYCDVVLPSGLGVARNALVVRAADAVVLLAGGSGTLSEAALAWQLGKQVVALAESGGWAARLAGERIDDRRQDCVVAARNVADALDMLAEALAKGATPC